MDVDRRFRPYAEALLAALRTVDPSFHVSSARRSAASQKRLWDAYLRGDNRYTVAPPGCSKHQLGFAVDFVSQRRDPLTDPYLRELGEWWRAQGGEWGGTADPIHFALPGKLC